MQANYGKFLMKARSFVSAERIYTDELRRLAWGTDAGKLKPQLEAANIQIGYSNSRTCEVGLETNTGVPYVSIAYLVDECTEALK